MDGYLAMDRPQSPENRTSNNRNTTASNNTSTYILPDAGTSNNVAKGRGEDGQPPPYSNNYLTPTSFDQTTANAQPRPQLPALPPGGFRSQTSNASLTSSLRSREEDGRERGMSVPSTDSGIDADFSAPDPLSSTNTVCLRSSTIYECIDSNQYTEPSPHFFPDSSGGETTSSGVSNDPSTTYLLPTGQSNNEGALSEIGRRRNQNVYTPLNLSSTQVYTEACDCGVSRSGKSHSCPGKRGCRREPGVLVSPKHLRCLWCGLCLLALSSLFLLTVMAYLFFFLIPGMETHIRVQEDEMNRMQSDFKNLSEKFDTLFRNPASNHTLSMSAVVTQQLTMPDDIVAMIAELNDSVREFDSSLQQMGIDLQSQIDNINHVPDLKAISAVGNLSSCHSLFRNHTVALPAHQSSTEWAPSEVNNILRDNMVMSATCTVKGGDSQEMEFRTVSPGVEQYRCTCNGELRRYKTRSCWLHLVLCPRQLPMYFTVREPPESK